MSSENNKRKRLAVSQVLCKLKTFTHYLFTMALKIIDHGTTEYHQMVKLRDDILRKPLGLGFTLEELESEKDNMLIAAFEDDRILGCCMLVEEQPGTVRLRQMAVLNDLQGKGIGRALMNFAENIARDRGYRILRMHARANSVGFYEKVGYKIYGEQFTEVTIPHYVMEKQL
jgi:ribosomal protein S18 acetylase RimI-like enzyme